MKISLLTILLLFAAMPTNSASSNSIPPILSLLLFDEQNGEARQVSISWQRPTQREDNSTLNANEIKAYRIRYRKTGETNYRFITINAPSTTTDQAIIGNPGDQFELAVATIDISDVSSAFSIPVSLSF